MVQSLTLNEESIIEETVKTVGMEMALVHSYSIPHALHRCSF